MSRAAQYAAVAALAACLAGCVPIPYSLEPGFRGSRALGDEVPAFIESGSTTRAEVLARMGAPDVAALDSSWFYYESNYLQSDSGVIFFMGGPGAVAPVGASGSSVHVLRRLLVRFSDDGLVSTTDFQSQTCKDITYPTKPTPAQLQSCSILNRDIELRAERLLARVAAASGSGDARRFDGVLWKEGAGLPSIWANLRDDPLNCSWARRGFGTLLISETDITFLPPERTASGTPPTLVRQDRSQLTRVEQFGPSMVNVAQTAGLELTRADGRVASFTLCNSRGAAALEQIKEVLSLLRAPAR